MDEGGIMDSIEIKDLVRTRYGELAAGTDPASCAPVASSCCDPSSGADSDRKALSMGYGADEVAAVPEGANLGLGCGNPHAIAALRPGEIVVDLGSGAGFDCLLAARQVGPTGRVIGVDMTPEMLRKARANASRLGAAHVEFRLGDLEHLPIADASADVIISNCVVNLVPDKAQVFRDALRVLKPGGRLAISDVVATAPLPADYAEDTALLCGCVSGAAQIDDLVTWLEMAGFTEILITPKPESREMIRGWAPGRGIEHYVVSAFIEARKPH